MFSPFRSAQPLQGLQLGGGQSKPGGPAWGRGLWAEPQLEPHASQASRSSVGPRRASPGSMVLVYFVKFAKLRNYLHSFSKK